jgi:hypothetical protein
MLDKIKPKWTVTESTIHPSESKDFFLADVNLNHDRIDFKSCLSLFPALDLQACLKPLGLPMQCKKAEQSFSL